MSDTAFRIEQGTYGPRLVVTSTWSEDMSTIAQIYDVKELYLNYALGWEGSDLGFLSRLNRLELFWLIDRAIKDLSPVNELTQLRSLRVDAPAKTKICFQHFSALEECWLDWYRGVEDIFKVPTLETLKLGSYPKNDCGEFASLTRLVKLALYRPKATTVAELGRLARLKALMIVDARRLDSIAGFEALANLEELQLHRCDLVEDLSPLRSLKRLRTLILSDMPRLGSIRPIAQLPRLEVLILGGKTNVLDGDLSPIPELPRLRAIALQARRHYTHSRAQLGLSKFESQYQTIL
jgi:Leucine-rich repeat (LRR) protein